jgi:hypothetical protein
MSDGYSAREIDREQEHRISIEISSVGSIQHVGDVNLFNSDQVSDLAKSPIADAFDQHQVFNPPKSTVPSPVLNYFSG